ncbi:hypothetical protein [Roseomonas sp. KE2513]|uniref:hypothetical protein n=1 Tax=Roseomonas sp. KE2513 TaxID=2479202 RepID=UPI0018E03B23|nr:hypothetical protein [Roseomonas sp. KE2513]
MVLLKKMSIRIVSLDLLVLAVLAAPCTIEATSREPSPLAGLVSLVSTEKGQNYREAYR